MTDTDRRVKRALNALEAGEEPGSSEGLRSRVLQLDDIEILSRAKDAGTNGRTLVAYAAAFGHQAEINDQDGHYTEENHPQAFDRSVAERGTRFGVFYHHAKTLHGTPSERGSVQIGKPILVKPDGRGLLTHTALNKTPLAEDVLESVRNGDTMGMSFTGAYLRSDPPRAPYYSRSDGSLQHVVRKEIALIEYGPTPMPAYQDAAILGVRAAQQREAEREAEQAAQAEEDRERESVTLNGAPPASPDLEDAASRAAATARHEPVNGTHSHPHPAYGSQGGDATHTHEHAHDGDASHAHTHGGASDAGIAGSQGRADTVAGFTGDMGGGWVCDPDGTMRFDPDGDGDDDSTPEGDTDHDYWDADGNPLQPIPPRPNPAGTPAAQGRAAPAADSAQDAAHGAPAGDGTSSRSATVTYELCRHFAMTPEQAEALDGQQRALLLLSIATVHDRAATVDRSTWDASKAWAAGAASDDPAAFYNAICAGRKAGDPATQDAHALPHHYAPGDPPNADGVRNSLSRLPQTDGLTNAAAAKAHLEAHMKVISPAAPSGA